MKALTHPSQPNYFNLFSGATQGITGDGCYTPQSLSAPNLAEELIAAGKTFAHYNEGLPNEGSTACSNGRYAQKHNPWFAFNNVPLSTGKTFAQFPKDDFNKLPTLFRHPGHVQRHALVPVGTATPGSGTTSTPTPGGPRPTTACWWSPGTRTTSSAPTGSRPSSTEPMSSQDKYERRLQPLSACCAPSRTCTAPATGQRRNATPVTEVFDSGGTQPPGEDLQADQPRARRPAGSARTALSR